MPERTKQRGHTRFVAAVYSRLHVGCERGCNSLSIHSGTAPHTVRHEVTRSTQNTSSCYHYSTRNLFCKQHQGNVHQLLHTLDTCAPRLCWHTGNEAGTGRRVESWQWKRDWQQRHAYSVLTTQPHATNSQPRMLTCSCGYTDGVSYDPSISKLPANCIQDDAP